MPKQPDLARDVRIARDVERHIKAGLTLSGAARAVADDFARDSGKRLSPAQIEQIYRRNRPRTVS
jgi:hypothetical protein